MTNLANPIARNPMSAAEHFIAADVVKHAPFRHHLTSGHPAMDTCVARKDITWRPQLLIILALN
jgi:hypothetical protein